MPNSQLSTPETVTKDGKRVAVIRTSDSIAFKDCRRKWNWSSHLRMNLGSVQHADPLWLGSAMHFALEDYHGFQLYGKPAMALQAFARAFKDKYPEKLPDDWRDLATLGCDMMDYYELWLENRDPLATFILDEIPQLEVAIKIPIPMERLKNADAIRANWDEVVYSLTLDRVIEDEFGDLWIVEYKSAAQMMTTHFQTDPQIGRYIWAGEMVYAQHGKKIAGVIYQQHKKDVPNKPRILQNGTISTAANQATSRRMYKQALLDMYGDVSKAPAGNVQCLNDLGQKEDNDGDNWIRRHKVYRNQRSSAAEAEKILLEVGDMLNPDLSIYPHPTRMCPNYCSFFSPCVSQDDGSDYKYQLDHEYTKRPAEYDEWREELPDPTTFKGVL
jgi:hypothetical protein